MWQVVTDEHYVRDVSGKEIAIYSGSSLTQWNIWGLDNIGKINADTTRNYYLKDHLGSIRVVLNSTNTVISAQDYDACLTYTAQAGEVGYPLENRTYNASAMRYDFTGKERDNETSYDYFGARYYDSRIGRWGQVEPLLDKYITVSPYIYSLNNPIVIADIDGKDGKIKIEGTVVLITVNIYYSTGEKYGLSSDRVDLLNSMVFEANANWNKKGSYEGREVVFDIKAIETTDERIEDINANPNGENIALPLEFMSQGDIDRFENIYQVPPGVDEYRLFMGSESLENLRNDVGSHEIGHLLGLPHPNQKRTSRDIMGYSINRQKPRKSNIDKILKKNKPRPAEKYIKGVNEVS
ncbi:MAG TPA: RHS repeat-associated core domain-containing protein [Ignavibacteria bacterium]|nr:RHS repeat-associated core domain-containing protein [Ignavibacteria bacterium]